MRITTLPELFYINPNCKVLELLALGVGHVAEITSVSFGSGYIQRPSDGIGLKIRKVKIFKTD